MKKFGTIPSSTSLPPPPPPLAGRKKKQNFLISKPNGVCSPTCWHRQARSTCTTSSPPQFSRAHSPRPTKTAPFPKHILDCGFKVTFGAKALHTDKQTGLWRPKKSQEKTPRRKVLKGKLPTCSANAFWGSFWGRGWGD